MRDLEIFSGDPTPAALLELASWTLQRRAPYLGKLLALADSADPELRAAVLRVLAGARGVAGVRAIVRGLAAPEPAVRAAALDALRATARDAPARYAHAIFHPSVEVRRAALLDVPNQSAHLAIYLRADPACAELTAGAAWPNKPLPLAFDLFVADRIAARELLDVVMRATPRELAELFETEVRRSPQQLDDHLEVLTRSEVLSPARGRDVIDVLVGAIAQVLAIDPDLAARVIEQRLLAMLPKKPSVLARRLEVALASFVATAPVPGILEILIARLPQLLGQASMQSLGVRVLTEAAVGGLFRYQWPVRLAKAEIDRLLALPFVRDDLALAAAVVGLGGARLEKLAKTLGEAAIVQRLLAGDRGWEELCRLPSEVPALELAWLGRVEQASVPRYIALAARALGIHRDTRLFAFVDQIPRKHRADVFIELARSTDLGEERLMNVVAALAPRLDRAGAATILHATLTGETKAPVVARALCRGLPEKVISSAIAGVDDEGVVALIEICDGPEALPRDREIALATALASRSHPAIQAWATRMLEVPEVAVVVEKPLPSSALDEVARHHIASCPEGDLLTALGPALRAPVTGLVAALGERAASPSVIACAALLGCADPIEYVARELERFSDPTSSFSRQLDHSVVVHWNHHTQLPPLAHARLYRWEAHSAALMRWIDDAGGVLPALMAANALPGSLAASTLWAGIAECVVLWRYRDTARLVREGSVDLARYCAWRIDRPIGRHAARILVALVETRLVGLSAIRSIVLDRTADADAETREHLARLVRMDGMPEPPPRIEASTPTAELIHAIRGCRDLAELARWCSDPRAAVVQEAVLVLLVLGELGQLRLAQLLRELDTIPQPVPILKSIGLWDSKAALFAARELAARRELTPQWQFHVCLGLGDHEGALAAVKLPGNWFRRADWDTLVEAIDPLRCAFELADCSHHHAYTRAVALLLEQTRSTAVRDALIRFLAVDANRPLDLRRTVARTLLTDYHVELGLPLVIEELAETSPANDSLVRLGSLDERTAPLVATAIVDAALVGGHDACTEKRMWEVVDRLYREVSHETFARLCTRILEEGTTALARRKAATWVTSEALQSERLTRVAEVFAWGIRRGVELTGRLFRIHLTSKETDLGHTFLDGNRIFVSPLPLLRGEPYGKDIVEGLLLHEIGHHAYHRGEVPQALWRRAHAEGIGHLLNLIADEHLERNLRGVDRAYGDRLKRLDAFAFQHGAHEIEVAALLESLRGSAAAALIGTPLEVAFDEAAVRLRRGAVLTELEKAGHPLARFARALRMGLGNRHGDPLVQQALDLCGSNLRKLDMKGLYDLTVEIAELFGGAVAIAKVFGGAEGLDFGERDDDVFSGLDDGILQREVERILDPRRSKGSSPGGRDRLCINVNPNEDFDRITHVERVTGDPVAHRTTANEVARHAHRLRAFLDDLGLRWQPQHARIQGRALDRSRLRGLVTRGDPRILIAREPVRRTDLFLGTLIDCSGSMSAGDNIARARRFAMLVAEAVRPLHGVEARFFGFTDSTIYDAGDANDCHVTGLVAGGGNNDAAALLHAANVAATSQKRAKVLVMISDGLPTECSVPALRGLVTTLTKRKGVVCAQVAVRALEEECFPHYVVLDDEQPDVAVARFGRMIADLARRGLAQ